MPFTMPPPRRRKTPLVHLTLPPPRRDVEKRIVWERAAVLPGVNPDIYRLDAAGCVIRYADYGNRNSRFGWEKDHIDPNGPNDVSNLQALQWQNNVTKSDRPLPRWWNYLMNRAIAERSLLRV